MSGTIGGSIQAVSIRGRNFPVAADADASRKVGGFENEIQPNGDGTARKIMTRVAWMISGITLEINEDRGDQAFLQEIADLDDFVDMTITFASQRTWMGKGTITDEINFSSQNSTAGVTFSGPGSLTQQ